MTGPPPPSWAVDPDASRAELCAEGLWRLRLPLPWPGNDHVNAYAVAREDGLMLVDCGTAGDRSCAEALRVAVEQTGHRIADIRLLAITHAHSDHAGLAGWVRRQSGCEVWIHPANGHFYDAFAEPRRVAAARGRRARQEGVPERLLDACADLREELEGGGEPIGAANHLREGLRLPSAVGHWEVLETPGHAPSHVCLLQRRQRLAIVGDLVCKAFVPWFDYGCTPDPIAEYLRSLDRLEEMDEIELALPGHGRGLTEVDEVVRRHRDGVAERLAGALDAVRSGAGGAFGVSIALFGAQTSDIAAVEKTTESAAYLRHLRLRSEIVRQTGRDGVFRYAPAAR